MTTEINALQIRNLKIYPNPASNYISIEYHTSDINAPQEISMHTLEGKLLKKIRFSTNNGGMIIKRIDVSRVEKGEYLLKVGSDGKSEVVKIRVE